MADYCAAVRRYTDAIDAVLAQGHAAGSRYDRFCSLHRIEPGSGVTKLTAENLPPVERHIHRRLLGLTENLYAEFFGPTPAQRPALARNAPRALGSRHRI